MAKEYFAAHGISYTNYDVASDADKRQDMIEKSGQMGVPVIIIDNKDLIVGFDQEHIASLLGIAA